MIDEFRPKKLSDAARDLGIDPFELVRLSVAFDTLPENLRFGTDLLELIGQQAGVEVWWAEERLPADDNPARAAVRGALGALLRRGYVGAKTTRLDNLSRGLDPVQADAIAEAVAVLSEGGQVLVVAAAKGTQVSAAPGQEAALSRIADGSGIPDALAAIWTG